MDKEETINFLLCGLRDKLEESSHDLSVGTLYYVMEACLRFATRASIHLNIPFDQLEQYLSAQYKWNKIDMGDKGGMWN